MCGFESRRHHVSSCDRVQLDLTSEDPSTVVMSPPSPSQGSFLREANGTPVALSSSVDLWQLGGYQETHEINAVLLVNNVQWHLTLSQFETGRIILNK